MCIVKTPTIETSSTEDSVPEPTIIRNPYLDGVDPQTKALRRGRSSLRIERGRTGTSGSILPSAPPIMTPAPNTTLPVVTPAYGGGGGGRGLPYIGSTRQIY